MFGAGQGSRDMVYITISTGIGGGIISEGKILGGVSGTAGELGHMSVDMHGERCNCGNYGCLERIASGTGIASRASTMVALGKGDELLTFALAHPEYTEGDVVDVATRTTGPVHISARTVSLAAEAGIVVAQEIIGLAAHALGVGLVNIIHIFNPNMIILGGGVTQIGPRLLEPARRIVRERAMKVPREAARIVPAQLGHDVGLVGAGALPYYHRKLELGHL
jgi:glucokinase